MLLQITSRNTRTDRYTGRRSTTFHVEQGFGYGFDSNGDYEVRRGSGDGAIRKSVFAITNRRSGTCTVTEYDASSPSRTAIFDVRSNLSTYTVTPRYTSSIKYVVTQSVLGYRLAKLTSRADTPPYDDDPSDYSEACDAFDVVIFMDVLEAEEGFDAIPQRPFRPTIPPPRALPRGIEARIEARRRANGIPLDEEVDESDCLISLN